MNSLKYYNCWLVCLFRCWSASTEYIFRSSFSITGLRQIVFYFPCSHIGEFLFTHLPANRMCSQISGIMPHCNFIFFFYFYFFSYNISWLHFSLPWLLPVPPHLSQPDPPRLCHLLENKQIKTEQNNQKKKTWREDTRNEYRHRDPLVWIFRKPLKTQNLRP